MSGDHTSPIEHPEVRLASAGGFTLAYVVTLALMLLSSALVLGHALPPDGLTAATGLTALVAVGTQMHFLFKLDLSGTRMWHTVALVLTIPLIILAIGLTAWMFHGLTLRTMLPGPGM